MHARSICLAILHFGEQSGYDIKKMCSEGYYRHFVETSLASIYPTLAKLEDEGLVTARIEQQLGKPNRKIYAITPAGLSVLVETFQLPPNADKHVSEFLMFMKCCHLLPRERVEQLIDERLLALDAQITELTDCIADLPDHVPPGGRFCAGYGLAVYTTERDYLNKNRHLVEEAAGKALNLTLAAE